MFKQFLTMIFCLILGFLIGHLSRADYDFLKGCCPFAAGRDRQDKEDELLIKILEKKIKITIEKEDARN